MKLEHILCAAIGAVALLPLSACEPNDAGPYDSEEGEEVVAGSQQALDSVVIGPILTLPHAALTLYSEAGYWGDQQVVTMNPASGQAHYNTQVSSTLFNRVSSAALWCNDSSASAVLSDASGREVVMSCIAGNTTKVNLHVEGAYPDNAIIADKVTKVSSAVHPDAPKYFPLSTVIRTKWEDELPAAINESVPGGIKGWFVEAGAQKEVELDWVSYDRFKVVQEFVIKAGAGPFSKTYHGGFEILVYVVNDATGAHIKTMRTDAWVNGACNRELLETFCSDLLTDRPWEVSDDIYRAMRSAGTTAAAKLQVGLKDLEQLGATAAYIDPQGSWDIAYVYR